jgi:putative Ca2+/H+ antiporter (TMEM165/GDT1 family)
VWLAVCVCEKVGISMCEWVDILVGEWLAERVSMCMSVCV